jgi:hypothetical protein
VRSVTFHPARSVLYNHGRRPSNLLSSSKPPFPHSSSVSHYNSPLLQPVLRIMSSETKFEGWVAHDKTAVDGKLVWEEYQVKEWKDDDVRCVCQ